jgi:hypothetical protein
MALINLFYISFKTLRIRDKKEKKLTKIKLATLIAYYFLPAIHIHVRTHLEKTIGQTVKFFKSFNGGLGNPSVIGVEPFNESQIATFSD